MHRGTHMYSPMHTHIQHTQRYKHTHTYACTESHKYIHTDTQHTQTQQLYIHTYIYIHIQQYTYTQIHTNTRIHIRYTWRHMLSLTHTHTHTHTESWERQHMDATPTFPILQACLFKLLSTFRNGISKALQQAWRSRNHTSCPQGILNWEEDTHTLVNTKPQEAKSATMLVRSGVCVRGTTYICAHPYLPGAASLPPV